MTRGERMKIKMDAVWKARDNETAAFAQRAAFAWGLLMFCYGGYGYVIAKILFSSSFHAYGTGYPFRVAVVNGVLLCLAAIAAKLSVLWIKMLKGAYAWAINYDYIAEAFQHRFCRLSSGEKFCPYAFRKDTTQCKWREFNATDGFFEHKNCMLCKGDPSYACVFSVLRPELRCFPDVDLDLLSLKGGAFSPAKISIAIARFSLIVSLALTAIHCIVLVCDPATFVDKFKSWFVGRHQWYLLFIPALLLFGTAWQQLSNCFRFDRLRKAFHEDESMTMKDIMEVRRIVETSYKRPFGR